MRRCAGHTYTPPSPAPPLPGLEQSRFEKRDEPPLPKIDEPTPPTVMGKGLIEMGGVGIE